MKTLPRNVTPFTLQGWPLDALDQETMVELRKLADQTGWTVAEVMHEVTKEYVARRKAEKRTPSKNSQVPGTLNSRAADSSSRNAVSFSSARTTKRFPLPRRASTIQIVRPL